MYLSELSWVDLKWPCLQEPWKQAALGRVCHWGRHRYTAEATPGAAHSAGPIC